MTKVQFVYLSSLAFSVLVGTSASDSRNLVYYKSRAPNCKSGVHRRAADLTQDGKVGMSTWFMIGTLI